MAINVGVCLQDYDLVGIDEQLIPYLTDPDTGKPYSKKDIDIYLFFPPDDCSYSITRLDIFQGLHTGFFYHMDREVLTKEFGIQDGYDISIGGYSNGQSKAVDGTHPLPKPDHGYEKGWTFYNKGFLPFSVYTGLYETELFPRLIGRGAIVFNEGTTLAMNHRIVANTSILEAPTIAGAKIRVNADFYVVVHKKDNSKPIQGHTYPHYKGSIVLAVDYESPVFSSDSIMLSPSNENINLYDPFPLEKSEKQAGNINRMPFLSSGPELIDESLGPARDSIPQIVRKTMLQQEMIHSDPWGFTKPSQEV